MHVTTSLIPLIDDVLAKHHGEDTYTWVQRIEREFYRRFPEATLGVHHRMGLAMDAAGLRQSDLADVIGCHPNTIANYLTGRTRPRKLEILAWADTCGVPNDWLVEGSPPPGKALRGGTKRRLSPQSQLSVTSLVRYDLLRLVA